MAETIAQVLQHLTEIGVGFYTKGPGNDGFCVISLSIDDILKIERIGRYEFLACRLGVSIDHLQAWESHISNQNCHAINKKGEPCKAGVATCWDIYDFNPDFDNYCYWHQGK